MYIYIYTYIYIYLCVCIYIYIYMHLVMFIYSFTLHYDVLLYFSLYYIRRISKQLGGVTAQLEELGRPILYTTTTTHHHRRRRRRRRHHPAGVVHRSFCLNSNTSLVSETASRWWCIESLLPGAEAAAAAAAKRLVGRGPHLWEAAARGHPEGRRWYRCVYSWV